MYFPDEPLNIDDRVLLSSRRPDMLIALPLPSESDFGCRTMRFDIVLALG
jgi:hypothetical protein